MGVDYIKNLKIDKSANKIVCDIADGNVRPLTYYRSELYCKRKTFEEKYACLMRDIISGQFHFSNSKNNLYKISFDSPYNLKEISNYYDDLTVLGPIATYNKYKNKIDQILKDGTDNRILEVIPSIYEERFILDIYPDKFKDNLNEICRVFNNMDSVFRLKNNLDKQEKIDIFNEILKGYEMQEKPIFVLKDKEAPEIKVCIYPSLENTRNDDVYLTFYLIVNNEKYQRKYDSSLMITYLTSSGIEDRIKQFMYEYEHQFNKDISQFMIDAENLSEIQYIAKDTLFYENYREPLIALRENGYILEITKEKGKLISSLYTSNNNLDKCDLIIKKTLEDEFLDKAENLDDVKRTCMKVIVDNLQCINESQDNEEETEL